MNVPEGTRKQRRTASREGRRVREDAARRQHQRQRRQRWMWWGGGGVVVLVVLGIVAVANQTQRASAAPTVDGIQCVATEGAVTHIHQHLAIYDAGKLVPVPQGIGVNDTTGCLFAVHTHSPDGVIHVESPTTAQNTLGQFFDIWGQPLSRTQVASATAGHGQSVRAYINGRLYTGNPRAIPLTAHALITLEVGPPWAPPTTRFSWPAGT